MLYWIVRIYCMYVRVCIYTIGKRDSTALSFSMLDHNGGKIVGCMRRLYMLFTADKKTEMSCNVKPLICCMDIPLQNISKEKEALTQFL